MSRNVIDLAALRIAEHTEKHGVRDVQLVLHGGEPLLAGAELIAYAVATVRGALGPDRRANVSLQTNGTRLDEPLLAVLGHLGVTVGLSLDGDRDMHDRHRRQADGRGSHVAAAAAATLLSRHQEIFSGIISVIDLRNDPVRAYESLLAYAPPTIDFLLPHGNWSAPPPARDHRAIGAPYGDWLVEVFERWYRSPVRETGIRLFNEIINLVLGGASRTEGIGLSPVTVVVIESDGSIEQSDMLKTAHRAGPDTGLCVATDSFDAVLRTPGIVARQIGSQALAPQCQACVVGRNCGGGLYPHRYRVGTGFANPSVYCADLYRLISHIRSRVQADLLSLAPAPGRWA